MMKKLCILILALSAALAACTKEESAVTPDSGDTRRLTFTIDGANGSLATYSGVTVPGNGFEKTVGDISVYLFDYAPDGSGVLRSSSDFGNLTAVNGKVTLTMDTDASLAGEYVAYFVANNATGRFADMGGVTEGATTELSFRNMPAEAFADVPDDTFLITGRIDEPFPAHGEYGVTLRNRVARFDVVNTHPHLTVTKVTIRDAADRTAVFGDATQDPGAQAVNPADITAFAWDDYEIDGEVLGQVSESAFFLHPTSIPAATRIYVEGYTGTPGVDDQTFVYEVDSPSIEILANYRYLLNVADNAPITLEIAGEWEVDVNASTVSAYPMHLAGTISGTAFLNGVTHVLGMAGSSQIRVITANPAGASYEFIPVPGDPAYFMERVTADFNIMEDVKVENIISYSSPTTYYQSKLQFTTGLTFGEEKSFVSILRISDGGTQTMDIILHWDGANYPAETYPGSTLAGVKVGGITWAPVNAGSVSVDGRGIYAQWNRARGFRGGVTTDVVNGPLPYEAFGHSATPSNSLYYQPFIINRTSDGIGDWLVTDDPYTTARLTLWNNSTLNPCPDGWAVPTAAQFQTLIDSGTPTDNGTSITFTGDDGISTLTLPYCGYLDRTNGKLYGNGIVGRYWSMGYDSAKGIALTLGSGVSLEAYPRAMGGSVRCVKQ